MQVRSILKAYIVVVVTLILMVLIVWKQGVEREQRLEASHQCAELTWGPPFFQGSWSICPNHTPPPTPVPTINPGPTARPVRILVELIRPND